MLPFSMYKYREVKQLVFDFVLKPLVEAYEIMKGENLRIVDYDENTITKKLVWYLKNRTSIAGLYQRKTIVIVMRPKEQATIEETYEPDMKFFLGEVLWMEIEAKRFYKGNNWSTSEYLSDNDGVGRFLSGKYSKNETYGGMVGYVQSGNLQDVISSIKSGLMVKNCRQCQDVADVKKCLVSIHYRLNDDDIEIYHLFLYFSSTNN